MLVPTTIKNQIEEKVLECLCKAEDVFRNNQFPMIPIRYDLTGRTAGQFCRRFREKYMRVNNVLLMENTEHYIQQTIPHEVAHYIAHVVYGNYDYISRNKPIRPHGKEWKAIMERVLCIPSNTTHSYNTSNSRRRVRRHIWGCGCRDHKISTRKHNSWLRRMRMNRFAIGYIFTGLITCRICKSNTFTYKGSRLA